MARETRREVLLSDLSACRPRSALGDRYVAGKWKLLPYRHKDFSGMMLGAVGSRNAAPVKLPLKLKGWYEIHVGIYRTYEQIGLQLRLSSDRAWRKFRVPVKYDFRNLLAAVDEHFWTAADLTGESIHIAPLAVVGEDMDNYLAWFRLVPLSPARVRALKKDRKREDTKRLIAMNDATDILGCYSICDERGLAGEIDVYKDTDFRGVCWEFLKGDHSQFPAPGLTERRYPRNTLIPIRIYEELRRMWAKMDASGLDYLGAVRELTRSAGLELHVSHRMGHSAQVPYEEMLPTPFFRGEYDDYCRLADGAPVQRFAYARPHVQDKMLKLYEAAAAYGVDGFHLLFIRGGPVVLYEDEMVEHFRKTYSTRTDPRKLLLHDKRLLHVRGELFAQYLRRLRKTVHSAARKAGHKPPLISVHGLADARACAVFGLDLASWAREGLIDRVVASSWGTEFGRKSLRWPHLDVDFYVAALAGTRTKLWAEIPPPPAGERYRRRYADRAETFYRKGVQGLYFWDTPWRHAYPEHFNALRVLGHKGNLAARVEAAQKQSRVVTIESLEGVELAKDRWPPWLSG